MDMSRAIEMVAEDQQISLSESTPQEVAQYVRGTIHLPGHFAPGSAELEDMGDELSEAYRLVLTSSKTE